jgi:phosphatidylinositol alpha-mannosyltransferase
VNSHIRAQAVALERRGHAVTVFGAASGEVSDGEISVGRAAALVIGGTDTPIGIDPRAWSRVGRLLRAGRFDVVHVHEPLMPLVPWFVVRQSSAPIVATFHTHREEGHRWYPTYRWLLDPLMRRVQRRVAVSDAARRTVARHFPGHYEIVPNGIDVSRFDLPQTASRPREMPGHRCHVLYVGRLEPRKGVDRLVRAMAIVQRVAPAAHLVVVGDGPDRPQLESLQRELGVDGTFVGRVSGGELPRFMGSADVVCSPALGGESFGIVLLEALAAGRPVVATRIPGYEELVGGVPSVRLVDPGSVDALAVELAGLVGNPEMRRAMGAEGPSFARRFDWGAVAERLEALYVSVLAHSVAGRAS